MKISLQKSTKSISRLFVICVNINHQINIANDFKNTRSSHYKIKSLKLWKMNAILISILFDAIDIVFISKQKKRNVQNSRACVTRCIQHIYLTYFIC